MKKLIVFESNSFYQKGIEYMAREANISTIQISEPTSLEKMMASITQYSFDGLLMDITSEEYTFKQFIDFITYFFNLFDYNKKLIIFSNAPKEVILPFISFEYPCRWIEKSLSIEKCTIELAQIFSLNTPVTEEVDIKLTHNERQTLLDLLNGLTPSNIAVLRKKSVKTISAHKLNALKKLNVKNMQQLLLSLNVAHSI